jgi:hypothetical protein
MEKAMSAAGAAVRSCGRWGLGLGVAAALLALAQGAQAQPAPETAPVASSLADWDGKSEVTLDELKRHAVKVGELLDHASARVDRLADDGADQAAGQALVGAIRQELDLSRQWNRHLTTILLEVAEARRDLDARERRAAAEIAELTAVAERARLELIALKESLSPEGEGSANQPRRLPEPRPGADQHSGLGSGHGAQAVATALVGPEAMIKDARQALTDMEAAQMTAAADIEAVRTKIIEALHTLAPHRQAPFTIEEDSRIDDSLSSKAITAWAASIASKLHHEGFEDIDQAR